MAYGAAMPLTSSPTYHLNQRGNGGPVQSGPANQSAPAAPQAPPPPTPIESPAETTPQVGAAAAPNPTSGDQVSIPVRSEGGGPEQSAAISALMQGFAENFSAQSAGSAAGPEPIQGGPSALDDERKKKARSPGDDPSRFEAVSQH